MYVAEKVIVSELCTVLKLVVVGFSVVAQQIPYVSILAPLFSVTVPPETAELFVISLIEVVVSIANVLFFLQLTVSIEVRLNV